MQFVEIFRLVEIINSLVVCAIITLPAYKILKSKERWRVISLHWANNFREDKLGIYLIFFAFFILFSGAIVLSFGEIVYKDYKLLFSTIFYILGICVYFLFSILIVRWAIWLYKI